MLIKFLYIYIFFSFTHRILIGFGFLPNSAKWLVELYAIVLVPVIFINFAIKKQLSAKRRYLFLILAIFVAVVIGALINQSSASAILLGLRHHFKYLPFFFLPLVYDFSEDQIKRMLLLLCAILLLQFPVAIIQRFVWFAGNITGDNVSGTVGGSGVLSVILVIAIAILYSLYLAKQISFRLLVLIGAIFFFPTTINETKVTFILLPLALTISTIMFSEKNILLKFKKISIYCVASILFLTFFIFMYDLMYAGKGTNPTFMDYIEREREGRGYLYYGDAAHSRIERGFSIGRFDSIMLAINKNAVDTGRLVFGIGIGNALNLGVSVLSINNEAIQQFHPDMTTTSNILWEHGILGLVLHLILMLFLFQDAYSMRGRNGFIGAFGLGWCSVIVIVTITLSYFNYFYTDVITTSFWLFSGIVVSKSYQYSNI